MERLWREGLVFSTLGRFCKAEYVHEEPFLGWRGGGGGGGEEEAFLVEQDHRKIVERGVPVFSTLERFVRQSMSYHSFVYY